VEIAMNSPVYLLDDVITASHYMTWNFVTVAVLPAVWNDLSPPMCLQFVQKTVYCASFAILVGKLYY